MRSRYVKRTVLGLVVLVGMLGVRLIYGGDLNPTSAPGSTMHTLEDIYQQVTSIAATVGLLAPVPKTGQTTSYQTGDDGDYEKGVAWPSPRFTIGTGVDGTNCVTDNLTGLMWARDASNACGVVTAQVNWVTALASCSNLNYGGYTDWRLPNAREMHSLIDYAQDFPMVCNTAGTNVWTEGNPFTGLQSNWLSVDYWSSTTHGGNAAYAWGVGLSEGSVYYLLKTSEAYVWPVRGGQ